MVSTASPSQDSKFVQDGKTIDHTPSGDVIGGDVVVVGTHPLPAMSDIAANALGALAAQGTFDFAQITSGAGFSAGDSAYWDANGTSVADVAAGDTLSGCVTSVSGDGELLGMVTDDSDAADTWVRVRITNVELTATIAGSISVSDITGSDSSLNISGLDAPTSGAGGTIVNVGGDGHTNGAGGLASYTAGDGIGSGDGGAASVVGGAAPGTGDGGAAVVTGGATTGGATGTGGAATIAGGASGNSTNGAGGVASVTGGAGKGSGAGAATSLVGGAGGTTGAGGAIAITGGASAGAGGTAGAVDIDTGAATGGTGAAITIGGTNATEITLGKMPVVPAVAAVAAAGSIISDATAMVTGINWVTGADATKGVALPAAAAGLIVIVKNDDTANAVLKVWPNNGTSDSINAVAVDGSFSMPAKTSATFACVDGTQWFTIPLLPS